jgi:hypothetical protein
MAQATVDRQERATVLAQTAHSWPTGTSKQGGYRVWFVPSQSVPGLFHQVSRATCDCRGFQHGARCVHLRALHVVLDQQRQQPPRVATLDAARVARLASQYDAMQDQWSDAA